MKKLFFISALLILVLAAKAQTYELNFSKKFLIDANTHKVLKKEATKVLIVIDITGKTLVVQDTNNGVIGTTEEGLPIFKNFVSGAKFDIVNMVTDQNDVTTFVFKNKDITSCQLGKTSDGKYYLGVINDKIDKLVYYYP